MESLKLTHELTVLHGELVCENWMQGLALRSKDIPRMLKTDKKAVKMKKG